MRVGVSDKDSVRIYQLSDLKSVAEMKKDFIEETVETETGQQVMITANVQRIELRTRTNLASEVAKNFDYYWNQGKTEEYKQLEESYTAKVQNYMDETVSSRGYDSIASACTYQNSTNDKFKSEGTACVAWRDSVWKKCYSVLNDVTAGKRDIPTWEELKAELPNLIW